MLLLVGGCGLRVGSGMVGGSGFGWIGSCPLLWCWWFGGWVLLLGSFFSVLFCGCSAARSFDDDDDGCVQLRRWSAMIYLFTCLLERRYSL